MNRYLLDTNVLVLHLRGAQGVPVLLDRWSQSHELYISVATRVEILAGMHPHEKQVTMDFLNTLSSLPVNEPIADRAGQIIHQQARRGFRVSFPDALIAATALEHDLTLVTTNVKHFCPLLGQRATALTDHLP